MNPSPESGRGRALRRLGAPLFLALVSLLLLARAARAQTFTQTDIPAPPGSGAFGANVYTLPNGNFVVVDPLYDSGLISDTGAVHLYDGDTLALISRLTGSTAEDQIGNNGVTVLPNGAFVVASPDWDNGAQADAGAVTWIHGSAGLTGTLSASNSLVGAANAEALGDVPPVVLPNGAYVVASPLWDNGAQADAGAVARASGATGLTGTLSAANALVGSTANDRVGSSFTIVLANGNYVVVSPDWSAGATQAVGAVTWGSGATGITGPVSAANSLVGGTANDQVGLGGVVDLPDGDYVVISPFWDNGAQADAGAVTWGNGASGSSGVITSTNSLVGDSDDDNVGSGGVIPLTDSDYVVVSPNWDNGAIADAGAVTWSNGNGSTVGPVSATNSLVGGAPGDNAGNQGVYPLTNGNYVVASTNWDNGAVTDAGAVTWGSGASGVTGVITLTNSLYGNSLIDVVGDGGVRALTNGNYVVSSRNWDNGALDNAGAVTWGDGDTGVTGAISAANSLVGGSAGDFVGFGGVSPLSGGDYIVLTPDWDNGATENVGAVTWGDGAVGLTGQISDTNSIVGSTADDRVGDAGANVLDGGDYVVTSPEWDGPGAVDAGAVTRGAAGGGTVGPISASNSLVGSSAGDQVGFGDIEILPDDDYVIGSPYWDNGATQDVGAVTWVDGALGLTGQISLTNSLVGGAANDRVGDAGASRTAGQHYIVRNVLWNNGAADDAGAVTLGNGISGTIGVVAASNSVLGVAAGGGSQQAVAFNDAGGYLVVGRPADDLVTVAAFQWPLAVAKTGSGSGAVTSSPGGISCGVTCTLDFNDSITVTLTATPGTGSAFAGWSGACTGTGVCVVKMTEPRSVTATFAPSAVEVDVSPAGAGGTVTVEVVSNTVQAGAVAVPVRVGSASESYPIGTVLRLTAKPFRGYNFDAWGGDASGSVNPLDVTVTGPLTITAAFGVADVYLPVIRK